MWGEGSKKSRSFRMCLNLNDYQFKSSSYRSTYRNSMVTINKKTLMDTQKLERKEYNHSNKENHQATGKRQKEE